MSKADGDDDAGVGDGQGEERADSNQLANEEKKRANQPDEQKDLSTQKILQQFQFISNLSSP